MGKQIEIKQVKKNVVLSISSQIISLLVSFLMNLILPKFISEYQYAYWQLYLLYVAYVGVLHFGMLDGIVLRYSQYDYEELDKKVIRSQFKILIFFMILFSILGILYALTTLKNELRIVIVMTSIGIVTRNIFNFTSYTFQITNRIKYYASMIIYYRFFYGVVAAIMLLLGKGNFYYFCLVDVCSDLFGVFVTFRYNKELYIGKSIEIKKALLELKNNIQAGIKLMFSNWSAFLLTGSARLIIQMHWSTLMFGKVSFSFSVINLFLTFVSALSVVMFPSLKRTNEKELPSLYMKIRNILAPALIVALLLYYPGCFVLNMWLPKYNDSLVYLGILLPIIVYSSKINLLTNNYLKALRNETIMMVINTISVVVAIILFSIAAFVFNSINFMLLCIVLVMLGCSVASEIVVMKTMGILKKSIFIPEIVMVAIFIVLNINFDLLISFVIYLLAIIIFLTINYKAILMKIKK